MTHAEILEQIKKLSLKERLEVIDAAIHLLRDELTRGGTPFNSVGPEETYASGG